MGLAAGGSHNPLPLRLMSDTPDWSQVATQQDFKEVKQAFTEVRQELKRLKWTLLVGFTAVLILPDGCIGLTLATALAQFF